MSAIRDPTGPDFVCIGAQKAGTTWLYDNLAVQPGVWLPPIKELHFFNTVCPNEVLLGVEERSWSGLRQRYGALIERPSLTTWRWLRRFHREPLSTRWYRSLFPPDVVGSRSAGDITPAYSTLDRRGVAFARRVLKPGCRILLLIRHPVERIWSALKMRYRWTGDAIEQARLDELLAQMDEPGHALRTDYARMIRLWRDEFEADFRVFAYEGIAEQPERLLESICDFIGAKGELKRARLRQRSNRDPARVPMPPHLEARLSERFRPQLEELATLVPEVVEGWLRPPAVSSS